MVGGYFQPSPTILKSESFKLITSDSSKAGLILRLLKNARIDEKESGKNQKYDILCIKKKQYLIKNFQKEYSIKIYNREIEILDLL